MNNKINDGTSEYSFPEVDGVTPTSDSEFSQEVHANIHDFNKKINQVAEMEKSGEKPAPKADPNEFLKVSYEKKLLTVNRLITKLNDTVSIMDNELYEIIQDIIQKTVKKIISREIASDPKLIRKMIAELKAVVADQNGLVNVFISEADYKRINEENKEAALAVSVQEDLAEGDIVIKCNSTEIRALLEERIEHLLQAEDD